MYAYDGIQNISHPVQGRSTLPEGVAEPDAIVVYFDLHWEIALAVALQWHRVLAGYEIVGHTPAFDPAQSWCENDTVPSPKHRRGYD